MVMKIDQLFISSFLIHQKKLRPIRVLGKYLPPTQCLLEYPYAAVYIICKGLHEWEMKAITLK